MYIRLTASCIVVVGVNPRKPARHFLLRSVNAPPNPTSAISVYGYVLTCKVFLRWMGMRQQRWRRPAPSEKGRERDDNVNYLADGALLQRLREREKKSERERERREREYETACAAGGLSESN